MVLQETDENNSIGTSTSGKNPGTSGLGATDIATKTISGISSTSVAVISGPKNQEWTRNLEQDRKLRKQGTEEPLHNLQK